MKTMTMIDENSGRAIPRLIHQIWQGDELPPAWRETIDSLKQQNPNWVHRLYDEADVEALIQTHYGTDMLKSYRLLDPRYYAARSDFFRYLVVHALGGVYLDVKSGATRPLDDIIADEDQFLLSLWSPNSHPAEAGFGRHRDLKHIASGEYQQWHVIAAPEHPFLAAVINRVVHNIANVRWWQRNDGRMGVLRTTGPVAYTLAIDPIRERHPHRLITDNEEAGLRYNASTTPSSGRKGHYTVLKAPVVMRPWYRERIHEGVRLARETAKTIIPR